MGIIWATIILGPPFALAAFLSIRGFWPRAQLLVTAAALVIIFFAFGVMLFRLSFANSLANFVCVAVVYLAYCFLAASCLQIPFRVVRYLALAITSLPICFGYVLGTVGVLGLMAIMGDYERPPEHTEQMGSHLKCEITLWGFAGSASGYTVHLYKTWPEIPLLVREVVAFSVVQGGYVGDDPPADKTCSDALDAYSR
jgi:hypothetical protein